jgi:hypothetical protein
MRFIMLVKASALPDMEKYNEQLAKAGVLLDLSGLQPMSNGARVQFSEGKPRVIDDPFTDARESIAGYWLIQANSKEEAIEWAKRVPFHDGEIEIRRLSEMSNDGF